MSTGPAPGFSDVLGSLLRGDDLDADTTAGVMSQIMEGDATPAQIAGLMMALRMKGETAEEISGLVRAMREFALRVNVDGPVVDTCGTGGDRAGTFNVSTIAALVVAGSGAKVAKHGNRAASGRCGSADLLEAWGVAIDLPPEGVQRCIAEVGIGFCFAPKFHPAMRHVIPTRRELGVPTVFNFLGPLTNPARAGHQSIGVSDATMAPRMAEVLAKLGTTHSLVFHGSDGLDELTTTGPSTIWEITGGEVHSYEFDPVEHGIPRATPADLKGGEVEVNLRIAEEVLGGAPGPRRDVVVLGAAAALIASDRHESWAEAISAAAQSLDTGAAREVLDRWVALSKTLA